MTGWTTPVDVQRRLRRRWDSGELLRRWGRDEPWEPIAFPLRGPTPAEIATDLAMAQAWAASWERAARHMRIERRRVGGRLIGANDLPARAWIDGYVQAWSVLGVAAEAERFGHILAETRSRAPRLVDWLLEHPLRALDAAPIWPALVDTVLWIDAHADRPVFLRQIDVPGVDTKFIEQHKGLLAELLDRQLPPARIDQAYPRSRFAARYRFLGRPAYVRLRTLDPDRPLAGGYTELTLRRDELIARPPDHADVYLIENETTYLAFPAVPNALALFGGGYAVSVIEPLRWLHARRLAYWGDIDTHGFVMLDRVRQHFPHTRSLLMDRETLLAHESQWVREDKPVVTYLRHLHPDEADLYRDLVEDALGNSVRLEQERVSYGAIERAVAQNGSR